MQTLMSARSKSVPLAALRLLMHECANCKFSSMQQLFPPHERCSLETQKLYSLDRSFRKQFFGQLLKSHSSSKRNEPRASECLC